MESKMGAEYSSMMLRQMETQRQALFNPQSSLMASLMGNMFVNVGSQPAKKKDESLPIRKWSMVAQMNFWRALWHL